MCEIILAGSIFSSHFFNFLLVHHVAICSLFIVNYAYAQFSYSLR